MREIASTFKIAFHKEKLRSYLRGEPIYPATLELDISNACDRNCPDCPSTTAQTKYNLSEQFLARLFGCLQGQTRGLLLTGGEPTMAPLFPRVLRMAREHDFLDVAIVSNGSYLDHGPVADALLEHASVVRVSMYDWQGESSHQFDATLKIDATLKKINALRDRIEQEKSMLQIGVSVLTSAADADSLISVARHARESGAHWIYFHPMCIRWNLGMPTQASQEGVIKTLEKWEGGSLNNFRVFVFHDRYKQDRVEFIHYHAAHFLLVVGADGKNYLGAEVKYQPRHVIHDLSGDWRYDFLWDKVRMERIRSAKSQTYPAIGSRHRGVLYNDLIERLKDNPAGTGIDWLEGRPTEFDFPHIL